MHRILFGSMIVVVIGMALCPLTRVSAAESSNGTAQDIAELLWTAQPEQFQKVTETLAEVPVDAFSAMLAAIYQSQRANEEGAPILMGIVMREYGKRVSVETVRSEMLKILKNSDMPIGLKRDILRNIQAWAQDDTTAVFDELDLIAKPGSDLWIYVQYGLSRLVRSQYSKATRQSDKDTADRLSKFTGNKTRKIIRDLLKHGSGDKMLDTWTAKILANYRKVTPHDLENALVQGLSEGSLDASKQLKILDLTCGWGKKSKRVADHVQKIKDKATREGSPLADADGKRAEKLLNQHRGQ